MDFPNYPPDAWGPEDAEALIARDGNNWIIQRHEKRKIQKS
jgi:glucose-6-phosphate 1-dehydrogenase